MPRKKTPPALERGCDVDAIVIAAFTKHAKGRQTQLALKMCNLGTMEISRPQDAAPVL